jgi:hypothetical protein
MPNNPYTSAFAPMVSNAEYQMPNTQALQQQQLFQNAMAQQQQGLVNEAGQVQGGGVSGLNPLAMASMLRKGGGTQLSDAQKSEISQLGSNSWNPLSDYNRGTNGWGYYGE